MQNTFLQDIEDNCYHLLITTKVLRIMEDKRYVIGGLRKGEFLLEDEI